MQNLQKIDERINFDNIINELLGDKTEDVEEIKTDGYIINIPNKKDIYKLKPEKHMTIDLKYDGKESEITIFMM